MKKKLARVFVATMVMAIFTMPKAEAVYPVHDSASLFEIVANFKMQFEQAQNHLYRTFYRITRMDDTLTNLEKISKPDLGARLEQVALETYWKERYILDAEKAKSKESGNYFASKSNELIVAAIEAEHNAQIAQGYVSQIVDDGRDLKDLIGDSQAAPGSLAAVQVGNQITALQTAQLMRLQYLIASSQHSQASSQARAAVRDQMVRQATERYYSDDRVAYEKGQGPGIIGRNKR